MGNRSHHNAAGRTTARSCRLEARQDTDESKPCLVNARTVGAAAMLAMVCIQFTSGVTAQEGERPPAVQHELITEYVRNPIEYRVFIKETLEGHMGALGLILTNRAPHSDQLPFHAEALANLTALHASLYPEDSATRHTRETIWSDAEGFASASSATAEIAAQLRDGVERGNAHQVLTRLVALGESCESCHARFRMGGDE